MNWFNTKRGWQLASLLLAISAAAAAFLAPIFTVAAQQGAGQTEVRATAYEVSGPSVFLVVSIPLLFAALPLLLRNRAWVVVSYICAVGLIIYTVTGIMSIGLFFLPATITAVIGTFIQPPE